MKTGGRLSGCDGSRHAVAWTTSSPNSAVLSHETRTNLGEPEPLLKREKHTLLKKGDLWIDPDTMLPWSGIMFSTFEGSSVVEEWIPVQNGQAHGVWETFYPDSSPKTRIGFLNGVLHGIDEEFS